MGRIYIYQEPSWKPVSAGERYTNDTRIWYTLKTWDWDGLIHCPWEDKRTKKQADYSEIKIFAWKYKMGRGLGSV